MILFLVLSAKPITFTIKSIFSCYFIHTMIWYAIICQCMEIWCKKAWNILVYFIHTVSECQESYPPFHKRKVLWCLTLNATLNPIQIKLWSTCTKKFSVKYWRVILKLFFSCISARGIDGFENRLVKPSSLVKRTSHAII